MPTHVHKPNAHHRHTNKLDNRASRPLNGANESLNRAFAGLGNVAKAGEDHQTRKVDNTSNAIKQLFSALRTPDEVQEAQSTGAIDRAVAEARANGTLDSNLDIAGLGREALTRTRTDVNAANTYADNTLERDNRGNRADITELARTNLVGALKQINSGNWVDTAGLTKAARQANQEAVSQGRSEAEYRSEQAIGNIQKSLWGRADNNNWDQSTYNARFTEELANNSSVLPQDYEPAVIGNRNFTDKLYGRTSQQQEEQKSAVAIEEAKNLDKAQMLQSEMAKVEKRISNTPELVNTANDDYTLVSNREFLQDYKVDDDDSHRMGLYKYLFDGFSDNSVGDLDAITQQAGELIKRNGFSGKIKPNALVREAIKLSAGAKDSGGTSAVSMEKVLNSLSTVLSSVTSRVGEYDNLIKAQNRISTASNTRNEAAIKNVNSVRQPITSPFSNAAITREWLR